MASWAPNELSERTEALPGTTRPVRSESSLGWPHPYERFRDREWDRDELADREADDRRSVDGWRAGPLDTESYW
jgi:hypothetical protein